MSLRTPFIVSIAVLTLATVLVGAGPAAADCGGPPTVTTDKVDYGPYESATISGSGFECATVLAILVTAPDGTTRAGDATGAPGPDVVITDENGAFTLSYSLVGTLASGAVYSGQAGTYRVDVIHASGAVLASTTFDDSQGNHSCVITAGGGLKCWGANGYGQLGDGTFANRSTPVSVVGLSSGVLQVSVGVTHSCALTTAGGVKCWGAAGQGQLGDGSVFNRPTPGDVPTLTSGVSQISADGNHSCAVTTGGGVKCWGYNFTGQLGDGSFTNRATPVNVTGLTSGVAQVSASLYHTCAVTTGGGAKCWGYNSSGELGTGNQTGSSTPVNVSGLSSGVALIRAGGNHTCALTLGGGLKCWGYNSNGQLGDGTVNTTRLTPVDVTGLAIGVVQVSVGYVHSCAVTTGGNAKCWGYSPYGQVGDGSVPFTNRPTPVDVTGLTAGVAQVRAGSNHTCALTTDGGVKCWGFNSSGQLGDGTLANRFTPVSAGGLTSGVIQLWDATVPPADSEAPSAHPTQSPAANSAGWNSGDVTVTWNWTDNTGGSGIDSANCVTTSTSSGEGSPLSLAATCKDLAGNTGSASHQVKVDKTAPTISAAATSAPNQAGWYNTNVTVHFTCSDSGGSGIATVGGCPSDETLSTEGSQVTSGSHTAMDAAGNQSPYSGVVIVKIDKTAPAVTAGGPYVASEGAPVALTGASAVDALNPVTVAWTVNSPLCTFSDATALRPNLSCVDNGVFTATITAGDGVNPAVSRDATVTVGNTAPALGAVTVATALVPINTAINASAAFTDPGALDTHTAAWLWGDGTASGGSISPVTGSGTASASHSYTAPGVYVLKLTVVDKDGGASSESNYEFVVAYDPNAGFATGSATINVAGAYLASPAASYSGKLGFNTKYNKNGTLESETEFELTGAEFHFHSHAAQWLAVSGAKAQFQGTGTVEGSTHRFGFSVTVIDGQATGGGGIDKVRLSIWDIDDADTYVYDTQPGAVINADPTSPLIRGDLKIRKK